MTDYHAPPHLPQPPPPSFASHLESKWKPHLETAPNCPRCASPNTKFCYYNNYSLSQPRYFCKSCRRYWTKGGSLRNVPVGGGCRKTRRSKSSRSSSSSAVSRPTNSDPLSTQLPAESESSSNIDLAAVFARFLNPPPTTSSPESADMIIDDLTAENSEIFFEELSDFLLHDENQTQFQKQGITEDYENFPIGLQPELGVDDQLWPPSQEFDSFSNYNIGNHHYDDQIGENWVNNVHFF